MIFKKPITVLAVLITTGGLFLVLLGLYHPDVSIKTFQQGNIIYLFPSGQIFFL